VSEKYMGRCHTRDLYASDGTGLILNGKFLVRADDRRPTQDCRPRDVAAPTVDDVLASIKELGKLIEERRHVVVSAKDRQLLGVLNAVNDGTLAQNAARHRESLAALNRKHRELWGG
jgi:hypothetical protein